MDAKKFSEFPKHLYHATKAPVIAHNSEELGKAEADGYGPTYIPQAYPKYVGGVLVNNATHKAAVVANAAQDEPPVTELIPVEELDDELDDEE